MSDQTFATLVATGVVVVFRLLDFFLPRGYIWRDVTRWAVRKKPDDEEDSHG
jgi:hypothetical protein